MYTLYTYTYIYIYIFLPPYEISPFPPVAGSALVYSYLCLRLCMLPYIAPIWDLTPSPPVAGSGPPPSPHPPTHGGGGETEDGINK